jgi:hypothetical protein
MNNFLAFADYGMVEKLDSISFRVYKDRHDYINMSIPYGFGEISSMIWQGSRLHLRTDQGVLFIFSDFGDYERI